MFEVTFDVRDFERFARAHDADLKQVPYALSRAMNDAAKETRAVLTGTTWPAHVKVRNPYFIRAALRTKWATKQNLRVEIYDTLGRGGLARHADGGTKTPRGANLAIPPDDSEFGSHGLPKSKRPAAIIAATPKRALRITPRGIFVGQGGRLRLKFALKRSVTQPKDVPFREDFASTMRTETRRAFPEAMARAMRTRRR